MNVNLRTLTLATRRGLISWRHEGDDIYAGKFNNGEYRLSGLTLFYNGVRLTRFKTLDGFCNDIEDSILRASGEAALQNALNPKCSHCGK